MNSRGPLPMTNFLADGPKTAVLNEGIAQTGGQKSTIKGLFLGLIKPSDDPPKLPLAQVLARRLVSCCTLEFGSGAPFMGAGVLS